MLDIVLESLRALILAGILLVLWRRGGKDQAMRTYPGWRPILAGFGLILFGAVLDITDNFPALNAYVLIGDTEVEAGLEKLVGYTGGFLLLFLGFLNWGPAMNREHRRQRQLMAAITRAQGAFISMVDTRLAFDTLLQDLLDLTGSEYGFIGEVHQRHGQPYLKAYAITNIAWNEETQRFYAEHAPQGLEFTNLKSLFGAVLLSGEPVIANDPARDPRRGGLPPGHPPLHAFLGLPVHAGGRMLGMLGIANRRGGYDQQLIEYLRPLLSTIGQLVEARQAVLARQAIEASHQRLSLVASRTTNGVVITDREGHVEWVNAGFERLTGYTLAEVVGRKPGEVLHGPATDPATVAAMRAAFDRGASFEVEILNFAKDGHAYWINLSVDPLRDEAGQIQGYIGIETDITRRKQAEEASLAAHARVQAVIDAASQVSIIATDADGLITLFNTGAEAMLGYSAVEMVGRRTPETIHLAAEVEQRGRELSREAGRSIAGFDVFVEHARQGRHESREWTYVGKDGSNFPVQLTVTAIRGAGGELLGFLGIAVDIGARKAAEAAQAASAQHVQAVLDHVIDGIITIDGRGIVASYNQSAERIFGHTAAEVIGHNVSMLMPEPHRSRHDGYLGNYRKTGVAKVIGIGREVEGQRKDGTTFPIDLAVTAIERDGQPLYIGIVRDITERRRLERLKSEFLSTVSHELRTPLTSIRGALGLIAGGALGVLPEQVGQLVGIAHKNSEHLTHLINDLLDMEKMAAGGMHFELQAQKLMPLVEEAIESNRAYGAERCVSFLLTARVDDAVVRVDTKRFLQVMANLLSNAAKYSPENGQVEIAVARLEDHVRVSVSDHGPGIPAHFRARIFEKFSQADASDTRQKGGSGLGLAITRELVQRMSGQIGFDSLEGDGVTFHVDLPLPACMDVNERRNVAEAEIPGAPRLLVVEDNRDVAGLLATLLRRAGFNVDLAGDASRAMALLAAQHYAAMTLDLNLPDRSGVEIIHALRASPEYRNLPIIVVSAHAHEGQLLLAGEFDAVDWLAKPFDETRLLSSVRQAVHGDAGTKARVLHVEDDADLLQVVSTLAREIAELVPARTLAEARALVRHGPYSVVILDLDLPDGSGWSLMADLHALNPMPRVIILSGHESSASQADAVAAAMVKSRISNDELLATLKRVIRQPANSMEPHHAQA